MGTTKETSTRKPVSDAGAGLQPGRWSGEYFGVRGHRGRLEMDIEPAGKGMQGKFRLSLRTEDLPYVLEGRLELKAGKDRRVQVAFHPASKEEGAGKPWTFDAHLRPAGSYAAQALFGASAMEDDRYGGVWIAWRFDPSRAAARRG